VGNAVASTPIADESAPTTDRKGCCLSYGLEPLVPAPEPLNFAFFDMAL
jgi:hypothetical protein